MNTNSYPWSITINVNPIKQPKSSINKGGDCGACCLAGILGWNESQLYELYKLILLPYRGGHPREIGDVNWWDLKSDKLHYNLHDEMRVIEPIIFDPINLHILSDNDKFSSPLYTVPWRLEPYWMQKIKIYLEAGYVGMTEIKLEGNLDNIHTYGEVNHWVLINGAKQEIEIEEFEDGGTITHIKKYVRVGCSVKGNYWIETDNFLKKYGGFNVAFIRKRPMINPLIQIKNN